MDMITTTAPTAAEIAQWAAERAGLCGGEDGDCPEAATLDNGMCDECNQRAGERQDARNAS